MIDNCLYTFGGWRRNANVHELNLTSMVWRHLKAQNSGDGPFLKDKAGMVAYGRHMVCVLGGYGYPHREHNAFRGQKGAQYDWDSSGVMCWTNELHLFHIEECKSIQALLSLHSLIFYLPSISYTFSPALSSHSSMPGVWISPEMTGTRPPPCAAFTLTKVDPHRVVLFGGKQKSERVNQLHILNMENWVCSGPILVATLQEF